MRPVIAITAKTEELRNRQQITLPDAYGKAIEDAGGVSIILPIISHKSNITSLAGYADGFLFSGGDDIRPGYYGEEQILDLTLSSDERTEFEIALLNEVIRLKKPVLGICLGAQLINVALGGSLYQDIPSQVANPLNHREQHNIKIVEGTMLYRIFSSENTHPHPSPLPEGEGITLPFKGTFQVANQGVLDPEREGITLPFKGRDRVGMGLSSEISIFSTHHQSIKSPGKSIIISAMSSDGVIEAIELPNYPFLIGVQLHPEREPESEYTRLLFKSFIEAASHRTK